MENSENRENPSPKKVIVALLVQPYSAELKNISDLPTKEANNPGSNCIWKFSEVSKEALIPNFVPQDFIQLLITRNCKYGKNVNSTTKMRPECMWMELPISKGISSKTLAASKLRNLNLIHLKLICHNVSLIHIYTRTTTHYHYDTPATYHSLHRLPRKYLNTINLAYYLPHFNLFSTATSSLDISC